MSTVLAFDTSCDDTSVAVVRDRVVLSNVIASQVELHKQFGGVFPTVAKQAHLENLAPSLKASLQRAQVGLEAIEAVAVTVGPGLAPSLEIGLSLAKKLALDLKIPFIPVNHIEGHLLSPLAERRARLIQPPAPKLRFPALGLVISGGHSDFVLINKIGAYQRIGFTIDDAAGECLDKIGRMVGLGYPAGATIEAFAQKGDANSFVFPLPMTESRDFNLSFSGMKTFARNLVAKLEATAQAEGQPYLSKQTIYDLCASAQAGVFRHILHKLEKILAQTEVKELWLGGGVAANLALRQLLRFKANQRGLTFRVPYSQKLCSDNAAMIGVVATEKMARGEVLKQPRQIQKVDRQPRWHIGDSLS